jgi:hypothetical protein
MSIIPTLVFPDAVQLVLDRLSAELPALVGHTVATGNRVPSPRPAEFVRVQRQGGTRVTVVTEAAQLAIEAWSTDVAGADQLAQACRSVLFGMKGRTYGEIPVYLVEDVGGPAEVADPLSDQPRAQFSVAVHLRGRTQ